MEYLKWQSEENQAIKERYQLSIDRINKIKNEKSVAALYEKYFRDVASFILLIDQVKESIETRRWEGYSFEEKQKINQELYKDILADNYQKSFANPKSAVQSFGLEMGQVLSCLYTEIRAEIAYVFENQLEYLAICNELFVEVYNIFEESETPSFERVKETFYWYASDYSDVFLADRIEEQVGGKESFACSVIMNSNLDSLEYLFDFGEYVSENEISMARHLQSLDDEVIEKMAKVYVEGYRMGFENNGKDLSIKSVVNIRYNLGFERVVKKAIEYFAELGLKPSIYRSAVSLITKRQHIKIGYSGGTANKQYDYDHKDDQGLVFDKRYMERKLDVMKNAYEKNKKLAGEFAGPAVIEVFGEEPFVPSKKKEAIKLTSLQEKLSLQYESKSGQLTNQYIKGSERSFTIIAYPIPEIGENFEEIFNEVIRINTLDAKQYEEVQQKIIDALDQGDFVYIKGKAPNQTELKIKLHSIVDGEKETIFENCVADVNIPVGEVFTSPVLKKTTGVLHVSKVYLNELQYDDLHIEFKDGEITKYSCSNFEDQEEGKEYIKENILHNHESLPMGEFAIGTNTTAYVVAKKYGIEDKMPILIAEKMGPHFAVGDTCYSWSEDNKVYNQNGKEIIAKDNEISILRKEDPSKAYFHCHTDITIPYEELESISVITVEGDKIRIIEDGKFVLDGTEFLNDPFDVEK